MIYGEKLKKLRKENNLTHTDLGNIISINRSGYGQYEREYIIIPIKHLNELANYYNTSLDYIFSFTETRQYNNNTLKINNIISGKRLKEFRKENNLTQAKLASKLNTTNTVISDYEIGRYTISTPFLYDICKKYNISADYLLGKVDSPKYLK